MEQVFRGKLNSEGRLNIPAPFRKRLGLQPGQDVLMQITKDGLVIYTQEHALKRLQDSVASFVPSGVSLSDELIADRRAEAAKEERE